MNKRALILGGGFAGCSIAYLLGKEGWDCEIIESGDYVGGLARTRYLAGHPHEFGPHVFFWKNKDDGVIDTLLELTEVVQVNRRPVSFVSSLGKFFEYPVGEPTTEAIEKINPQLASKIREEIVKRNWPLPSGEYNQYEYWGSGLGPTLRDLFMADYSHKMWGVPMNELHTKMTVADQVGKDKQSYDPLRKKEGEKGLGNLTFQIYPKNGWNPVLDKMTQKAKIIKDKILGIDFNVIKTEKGSYSLDNYDKIISTISLDVLLNNKFGELPYMGRIIIPMVFPKANGFIFPEGVESQHYCSSDVPQTRITEMDKITQYQSSDNTTLFLVELPVYKTKDVFTTNFLSHGELYQCEKAYPVQTQKADEIYQKYLSFLKENYPKIKVLGRLGNFKYWGMAETLLAAINLSEELKNGI